MALILKHASAARSSGEWSDDDYDVLANGKVVGRIFKLGRRGCGHCSSATTKPHNPTHGLCNHPRGRDGCIRQELAAGVTTALAAALLPTCRPKSCNAAK
jgi:hypothetical protein